MQEAFQADADIQSTGKLTATSTCLSTNLYVAHTVLGRSLRSLAQELGVHPSTVMRRVHRIEDLRDDPLIDDYLDAAKAPQKIEYLREKVNRNMKAALANPVNKGISKEEIRVLRRLCESGCFLAISSNYEAGAILRKTGTEEVARVAVVSREIATALTVSDYIKCTKTGAVSVYHVTETGRSALRRALLETDSEAVGFAENQSVFAGQHREYAHKVVRDDDEGKNRKIRVNIRESPLTTLARKKDANGKSFLSRELLQAGERLREDFELSQMGPRISQNWDRFLTGHDVSGYGDTGSGGSDAAAERLRRALSALGTGLGDIALRCCCYLEGLESAEKRMGWSARSGKIVLRIALQRLRVHYEEEYAKGSDKIG